MKQHAYHLQCKGLISKIISSAHDPFVQYCLSHDRGYNFTAHGLTKTSCHEKEKGIGPWKTKRPKHDLHVFLHWQQQRQRRNTQHKTAHEQSTEYLQKRRNGVRNHEVLDLLFDKVPIPCVATAIFRTRFASRRSPRVEERQQQAVKIELFI